MIIFSGTILTGDQFIHVFDAWCAELLFFSLVGAVVTLFAIRDPAQEVFDDRIRILFGRSNVPDSVLTYNKRMLSELSAYAKTAERTILLESFGPAFDAYKAKITTVYNYANLLPDVDYNQSSTLHVMPDEFGSEGPKELGRITSIRIAGREIINKHVPIFKEGFTTEATLFIGAGREESVSLEYYMWLKVGALQTVRPKRFVELFSMSILSQCEVTPRIDIDGYKRGVISLLYNDSVRFDPVQGVVPGEAAFAFKMLSPVNETP
jgi:hypothetical protein